MMEYICPKNPGHVGVTIGATKEGSPHKAEVICAECDEHIKWASQQDIIRINTETAQAMLDEEIENAVMCPLMSGMVIHPQRSEVRPARLGFQGNACIEGRCAWYIKVNGSCSITDIAMSLGTIADWRLSNAS